MKTKQLLKLFVLLSGIAFYACTKEKINTINYMGTAKFVMTNVTTGEQIEGNGIVIGIPEKLTVHQGDLLRLSYTPPSEYTQYTWKVSFELFNETYTEYEPFTMEYTVGDIEPGEYTITCSGKIEEEDIAFTGSDLAQIYVNIVK